MTTGRQRVVFVLPTLIMGGAERVMVTLMNGLNKSRFDVHLVALNKTGPLCRFVEPAVTVHSLGGIRLALCLPGLIKTLRSLSPDIVISTMAPMNFATIVAGFFLRKKTRIVVREAGDPHAIIASKPIPALVKFLYKFLYPRANLVIAPAQFMIDTLKNDLGIKASYELLYNSVDLQDITVPMPRLPAVNFVCAGRLHRQKGFDRLIEALPRLKHSQPWALHIYGTGPEEHTLEDLIEHHNLGTHVRLEGLTTMPWPIYGAADAILLPSRTEGMPNIALEALALGTPVIAIKDAGGIHEIAKFTNAVTIVDNFDDFLRAMEKVKANPTEEYRPSLLPDQFQLESVLKRFEDLLTASSP